MSDDYRIRPIAGIEEARAAAAFQEKIWGAGFSERVPASLLLVLPRVGSVSIAAFDPGEPDRMVGFVFGVTGVEEGEVVHWSDILGIAPEHRDRGLGRRLKYAQRDAAIAAGAARMYWTFDPLEARNAWMNVHHLGVGAREYQVDMYGKPDSPMHRGIGTDRLIARWELGATTVGGPNPGSDAAGQHPGGSQAGFEGPLAFEPVETDSGVWEPGATPRTDTPNDDARSTGPGLRIPIPADIQSIKAEDPERAVRWRTATREAFLSAFATGAFVVGIGRAPWGLSYHLASTHTSGELPA